MKDFGNLKKEKGSDSPVGRLKHLDGSLSKPHGHVHTRNMKFKKLLKNANFETNIDKRYGHVHTKYKIIYILKSLQILRQICCKKLQISGHI